jgi:hypothetical protein
MMLRKLTLPVLLFAAFSATDVAHAAHSGAHIAVRHGMHHGQGWGWHGRGYGWGFGFYAAAWPWFYPGYYGYAVPVFPYSFYSEQAAAPVEYIELNPAASPAPATGDNPSNDWYFCQSPEGYYPYVKTCAGGWQKVPAQPPK